MPSLLADVCCVCLPASVLPALAGLRLEASLRCRLDGAHLWLRWPAERDNILTALLPLPGAEWYALRDGLWYAPGWRLPVWHVPADEQSFVSLATLLGPAPLAAAPLPAGVALPVRLALVRDDQPRPASALRCRLADLALWADNATTHQLSSLRAAHHGERVLLLGAPLPIVVGGVRFWGQRVLMPLGYRTEPALPEALLVQALALEVEELALLTPDAVEIISCRALAPLTRAGVRLALREQP
jgi:hypothetical protein